MSHELFVVGDAKQRVEDPGYWFSAQHELLVGFPYVYVYGERSGGDLLLTIIAYDETWSDARAMLGYVKANGVLTWSLISVDGAGDYFEPGWFFSVDNAVLGSVVDGAGTGTFFMVGADGSVLWAKEAFPAGTYPYPLGVASDRLFCTATADPDAIIGALSIADGSFIFSVRVEYPGVSSIGFNAWHEFQGMQVYAGRSDVGGDFTIHALALSATNAKLWDKRYAIPTKRCFAADRGFTTSDRIFFAYSSQTLPSYHMYRVLMGIDASGNVTSAMRTKIPGDTLSIAVAVVEGPTQQYPALVWCLGWVWDHMTYTGWRSFLFRYNFETGAVGATMELLHVTAPDNTMRSCSIEGDVAFVSGDVSFDGYATSSAMFGRFPIVGTGVHTYGDFQVDYDVVLPFTFDDITADIVTTSNVLTVTPDTQVSTPAAITITPLVTHDEIS